jgi:1-acyl-sn-glycerol-3-phosphate acyltransferase
MLRLVFYVWRVFATGFAFVVFNVGGLIAAVSAIAVCRVLPGSRETRERRAQRVIQFLFASFILGLRGLGLLTCERIGLERLRTARPSLVIANHPTLLDVVFLISSMPHVDCVVKAAVWNNVFFRGTVRGAGYIPNSEGPELVDDCVERLGRGHHVLLFPEGTRSPAGALRRFQRGGAHIALRARCEIQPILITCEPPTLLKGMPFFHVPPRRPHFTLTLLDPIRPEEYLEDGGETPLAVRRLNAALEHLYETRLGSRCS